VCGAFDFGLVFDFVLGVSVFETPEALRFNGITKGVSDIGELLVETENAPLQKFQLKEVKLIY
jgi:BirA family biotin operon repressor/biotin-[acetyl-CoA-carboxylase] ligase